MRELHECLNPDCKNLTNNPKFCSRSCAAQYNNIKFPKRSKNRKRFYCKVCGIELPPRRTLCDAHNPKIVDWSKITIKDVITSKTSYKYSGSYKYGRIRCLARAAYEKSNRPKKCEHCGYSKHYHVAHIKPIYLFDLDTPISVVNTLDNLISLCPNCHWEFDNGYLSL